MREETFINYRGYLWLWVMLVFIAVLSAWYVVDVPIGGRSGASLFGYASGIVATAAIIYLMWFGIRKRSYYAHRVTLKGWLAAHIWIGLALLIIVPLHAAFDFGMNIHTLAYVFLCLVVFSGVLGAFFYRYLPAETISNRGGGALRKRFEDLAAYSDEISKIALNKSAQFADLIKSLDIKVEPSLRNAFCGKKIKEFDQKLAVDKLSAVPDEEREDATKTIAMLSKKLACAQSLRNEILVRAKLKIWLFAHIPLSLGLMVLVFVHIFSMLYFR